MEKKERERTDKEDRLRRKRGGDKKRRRARKQGMKEDREGGNMD